MSDAFYSILPVLVIMVPLFAVPAIISFGHQPNVRERCTFLAAGVMFFLVQLLLPSVLEGKAVACKFWEIAPGLFIEFRVDGLGLLFALVASSLWIVTTLYSIGYMRGLEEHAQTRFYAFFAVSLAATMGVAFSGNLLTMYLFYEMLSLATYPLVTHHQDGEARSGGRTYLAYLLGTSIAFALPALIICWMKSGDLTFSPVGFLAGKVDGMEAAVVFFLLVFGFAKGGLMPFHSWLPGAMVAPTPVSALLHAVAVVKVGVFCILRVITGVFGVQFLQGVDWVSILSWVAAFTLIVSSLIALSQDSLKRRLAFSTIGQLSYIILGASLLSPNGMTGSMLHIAMHAFGKITLFFCAGAIFEATSCKYVSQLKGIGHRMPVTMTAFAIGALSVIGLPPAGGLISKIYLITGTIQSGSIAMTCVYLFSSLLNAAYFGPIIFNAFFCKPEESSFTGAPREAHPCCVWALCITAGVSLCLFFLPEPFFSLADVMTQQLFTR